MSKAYLWYLESWSTSAAFYWTPFCRSNMSVCARVCLILLDTKQLISDMLFPANFLTNKKPVCAMPSFMLLFAHAYGSLPMYFDAFIMRIV